MHPTHRLEKEEAFRGVHTGIYEKTCVTASSEAKRDQSCASVFAWHGWSFLRYFAFMER
jgi:hypothetical protein